MPRFFIDTVEDNLAFRDEDGIDLPDLAAAKSEAVSLLPDLAREMRGIGDRRWTVGTWVRTDTGEVVFQASLRFEAEDLCAT